MIERKLDEMNPYQSPMDGLERDIEFRRYAKYGAVVLAGLAEIVWFNRDNVWKFIGDIVNYPYW